MEEPGESALARYKRKGVDYNENPNPCKLSKIAIEKVAAEGAKKLGFMPGGDLNSFISKIGGKVIELGLSDWASIKDSVDGAIISHSASDFTILTGADVAAERKRFTIAHELGHQVLHGIYAEQFPFIAARSDKSNRIEWESNWFAASFLMPEIEFREKYQEENGRLTFVAEHFKVSYLAARIRATALELLQ